MLAQIKTLSKLELQNIYGRNVFRYTKDPKAKRKAVAMMAIWGILIVMLFFYVGALSYGWIQLGLSSVIPPYLIAISSLLIFFFGIFKAGNVIFNPNGYDVMCSLPVPQTAIVFSRFLRMYVENLTLVVLVLFPGFSVYAWFVKPGVDFYVLGIVGMLFVPFVPMAGAAFIGALITGISSRMKNKNLVAAGLSVMVVLIILLASSRFSKLEGKMNPDMLKTMSSTVLSLLKKLYPPAVWFGSAIEDGNLGQWFFCIGIFLIVSLFAITTVSVGFHSICRNLYSTSAKHNYQMEKLHQNLVVVSLCRREFKRYFSSSIYVTNTIIGPIMGTVLSGIILFTGVDSLMEQLSFSINLCGIAPFALAGAFCMMTTTSTSISMEGKNWWIVKSLPLSAKSILDAKILMNLLLLLPFYVASEIMLILAFRPQMLDGVWLLLIPAIFILFSCVYGITMNLHFPVFSWENEVSVVKQSASAMLGGMGGFIFAILCAVAVICIPEVYSVFLKGIICIVMSGVTAVLYQKNNRMDLRDI